MKAINISYKWPIGKMFYRIDHGILTEGEGSVQLTSLLRWVVLKNKKNIVSVW